MTTIRYNKLPVTANNGAGPYVTVRYRDRNGNVATLTGKCSRENNRVMVERDVPTDEILSGIGRIWVSEFHEVCHRRDVIAIERG